MVFDFLKPYYYRIEQKVASGGIPDVSGLENRKTLQDSDTDATAGATGSFDHSLWDAVLKRHVVKDCTFGVVTGVNAVDYAALSKDDDFWAYMELLKHAADPSTSLAPAEQLCFWMNAYNAACIHLIVQYEQKQLESNQDYYPALPSINKISDTAGPVWGKDAACIAGRQVSLNHIEHDQLRAKWAEATVHACIVCASASCPNLRPEAFTADKVKEQMEDQMKEWMTNETKGFKLTGNRLELSRIFLWFANDFGSSWGDLRKYLTPYVPDQHTEKMSSKGGSITGGIAVRYFEYDWQINRAPTK
jgi:hypothetical protein